MVVSFLASNGTQVAPGSLLPSRVKEGMLLYDDTTNKLKVCDGTNWSAVGSGSDTLKSLSCSSGEIAKYNGTAWACASDGGTVTPASPTGSVQFNNAGAFGGDAALTWDNTNKRLGIGTPSPAAPLHVVESSGNGITVQRNGNASQYASLNVYDGAASAQLQGTSPSANQKNLNIKNSVSGGAATAGSADINFYIGQAGSENNVLTLQATSGNLGVGTTGPAAKLDINAGTTEGLHISTSNQTPYAIMLNNLSYGSTDATGFGLWQANAGAANVDLRGQTVLMISNTGPEAHFTMGRNIGADKGFPLYVEGTNGTGTVVARNSLANSYAQFVAENDQANVFRSATFGYAGSTVGQAVVGGPTGEQGFQGTTGNYPFVFYTNNTARTVMTGSGLIGIGTSAPQSLLHVAGGIQLGDDTATCPGASNIKLGTLRYNTDSLQLCGTSGWVSIANGASVTGTSSGGGNSAAAVTNVGWQNFPGSPVISLPSAGMYFVSSQVFYGYGAGCGDVYMTWAGSNLTYASSDGKWQACGASGSAAWNTYGHIITVSAATTLNAQYLWTNSGTSGTLIFGAGKYVKLSTGGSGGGGSGTPASPINSVQFNSAGAFGGDGALTWDNANKRLGIGTTSPVSKLDINASSGGDGVRIRNDSGAGTNWLSLRNAADTEIAFWDVSRIGAVSGNAASPGYSFAFEAGSNTGVFRPGEDTLGFSTAGSERLRIDTSGYVGIGTTAPTSNLTVSANTASLPTPQAGTMLHIGPADGVNGIVTLDAFNSAVNLNFRTSGGTAASPTATLTGTGLGNIVWQGRGATSYITPSAAKINAIAEENWTDASAAASLIFSTRPTGSVAASTERMRITGAGNVGIGTTSPTARLQVQDSGSGETSFAVNSASAADREMAFTTNNTLRWILGANSTAESGSNAGSDLFLNAYSDAGAYLSTGLFIKRITGNVGIGTTTPADKLVVMSPTAADTKIEVNAGGDHYASVRAANNQASWLWQVTRSSDAPGGRMRVLREGSGEWLTVLPAGNVGIGVPNPVYRLQSAGIVAGAGAYVNTSDGRLKTNVHELDDGLDAVIKLRPISFQWKQQKEDWQKGRKLGLIAQEVEKVVPEVVSTADDALGTKSIAYGDLTPVLIRAIQQLKADNDNLRAKLEAANDNYGELRSEVDALKAAVTGGR